MNDISRFAVGWVLGGITTLVLTAFAAVLLFQVHCTEMPLLGGWYCR